MSDRNDQAQPPAGHRWVWSYEDPDALREGARIARRAIARYRALKRARAEAEAADRDQAA